MYSSMFAILCSIIWEGPCTVNCCLKSLDVLMMNFRQTIPSASRLYALNIDRCIPVYFSDWTWLHVSRQIGTTRRVLSLFLEYIYPKPDVSNKSLCRALFGISLPVTRAASLEWSSRKNHECYTKFVICHYKALIYGYCIPTSGETVFHLRIFSA